MLDANDRYSCQRRLPGFGAEAQTKLSRAKVLVVGVGGLGCPASQYLVSAGIGTLALADADTVSLNNLHRQILFGEQDEGRPKVMAASLALQRQNPDVHIVTYETRVTVENVMETIEPYDVVLDCSDNFAARYIMSDACALANKPLVYGAAYQYEGQVAVWNLLNDDGSRTPHYRDIFPDESAPSVDCSSGGVMPTVTAVIGSMQAGEAIKYLANLPGILASQLLVFNALTMQSQITKLPRASWTPISELPTMTQEITVSELQRAPAKYYQLVDVRTPSEHAGFNIGGELVPLSSILSGAASLDTSRPIVFYCATGNRSAKAAAYVNTHAALVPAQSLVGGVAAWRRQ